MHYDQQTFFFSEKTGALAMFIHIVLMKSGVQWCISRGIKPANKTHSRVQFFFSFTDIITNGIMAASIRKHYDTFSEILLQLHFDLFWCASVVVCLNFTMIKMKFQALILEALYRMNRITHVEQNFYRQKRENGRKRDMTRQTKTERETKRLLHLIESNTVECNLFLKYLSPESIAKQFHLMQ